MDKIKEKNKTKTKTNKNKNKTKTKKQKRIRSPDRLCHLYVFGTGQGNNVTATGLKNPRS